MAAAFLPYWEVDRGPDNQIRLTVESPGAVPVTVDLDAVPALALAGTLVAEFLAIMGPASAPKGLQEMTVAEFLETLDPIGSARGLK